MCMDMMAVMTLLADVIFNQCLLILNSVTARVVLRSMAAACQKMPLVGFVRNEWFDFIYYIFNLM